MTRSEELKQELFQSARDSIGSQGLFQSDESYLSSAQLHQARDILGRDCGPFEWLSDYVEKARQTAVESGMTRGYEVLINYKCSY